MPNNRRQNAQWNAKEREIMNRVKEEENMAQQGFVKHSKRTVRKPCANCGSSDLYYAHRVYDGPDASRRPDWCPQCSVAGPLTLVDSGSLRPHSCDASQVPHGGPKGGDFENADQEDSPSVGEGNIQDALKELRAKLEGQKAQGGAKGDQNGQGDGKSEGEGQGEGDGEDPFVKRSELDAEEKLIVEAMQKADNSLLELIGETDKKVQNADKEIRAVNERVDELRDKYTYNSTPREIVVKKENGEKVELPGLHHHMLPILVQALQAGEHVLLIGPAGTGKGKMSHQAAQILELPYASIPLSPQTPESKITGYMQAEGKYVPTLYRQVYEGGGVFHFDEFDNAHPAVLAVVNDSLAADLMSFPDGMIERSDKFLCVASANTYGRGPDRTYAARQRGDAATWDRFTILAIDYDTDLENTLCASTGASENVRKEVLRFCRGLRKNAAEKEMPVVIGQRATVGMCRLINAGMSVERAVEARCRRGLSEQDWRTLTAGVRSIPATVK